jgi:hypothetical protein
MENSREQGWQWNHRVSLLESVISLTPDALHHGHGGGVCLSSVLS